MVFFLHTAVNRGILIPAIVVAAAILQVRGGVILLQGARSPATLLFTAQAEPGSNQAPPQAADLRFAYDLRDVEGWTVHLRHRLASDYPVERALELLRRQLTEIVRVVPMAAVRELRRVPLYFSPEYPSHRPTAEYHPKVDWLRAHGRDPAMAKGVEFTNLRKFEAEMDRMPNFTLHELAHAFHDRVLPKGFDNLELKTAYERAQASGRYDRVERHFGTGKPSTFERAYAMNNPMEYFAETSEAFFSRNDFFPFTRDELKAHDPEMFVLLEKLWSQPIPSSHTAGS